LILTILRRHIDGRIEPGTPEWSKLTWQEKREQRFDRWLNPTNIKFVDKEAEQLWKAVLPVSSRPSSWKS